MNLTPEIKQAFAEALKYAKVVVVDTINERNYHIVIGDSPEDTEIKVKKLIKKSLFQGHSVTFEGKTKWIEDVPIVDFTKDDSSCYIWDKSGNKILCERTLYIRDESNLEITNKVLRKIYKDFLKV